MITSIIAYFLLICFMVVEKRLRFSDTAKEFNLRSDRSTLILGILYGLNLTLIMIVIILEIFHHTSSHWTIGWVGIGLIFAGFYLRIKANLQLGKYYTRSLLVIHNQQIVSSGLYRYIRHPGYLGLILSWAGAGLATQRIIIFVIICCITFGAYSYRIAKEEEKLTYTLGDDYRNYMKKTKRIIPFLF